MPACIPLYIYIFCIILQLFAAYSTGNLSEYTKENTQQLSYSKIIIHVMIIVFCIFLIKYFCDTGNMTAAWLVLFFPCILASCSLSILSYEVHKHNKK